MQRLLTVKRHAPVKSLQRVTGQVASMIKLLGQVARIYTRALHLTAAAAAHPKAYVSLHHDAVEEIRFWLNHIDEYNSTKLWPETNIDSMVVYSEAGSSAGEATHSTMGN
jgi:hypothetical protein